MTLETLDTQHVIEDWIPGSTSLETDLIAMASSLSDESISAHASQMLGYDIQLILRGETTHPDANAINAMNELISDILGYEFLEGPRPWPGGVAGALEDVAEGRTTVHESTEALMDYLDELGDGDD